MAILIQNCAIEAVQNSTIFLEKFNNILANNPYKQKINITDSSSPHHLYR
jgi:hypothetical protein